MATPTIDYFSRDFDSLRTDMLRLIPFFTPEWTDRNPNDLGVTMVELFAYLGDILHFYVDRRAQDLYLPTAFTRQSVVNILKLIDYDVPGKQAATADEQFTITDAPYDEIITVPRTTKVQAPAGTGGTPVQFETLAEYTFGYSLLTANVAATADTIYVTSTTSFSVGQTVNLRDGSSDEDLVIESIPDSTTIVFTTTLVNSYTTAATARVSAMMGLIGIQEGTTYNDVIGTSDGSAWQVFAISREDVIEGSIEVWVDETGTPERWAEIESLGYAIPNEKVFELSHNYSGYVIVRFGNGSQGKIPVSTATVSVIVRVGGGVVGNVGADKITVLLDTINSTGGPVSISVTNPVESSGGAEEQSIDDAKTLGPLSLRALNRCVTLEDYAVIARAVPGVDEAKAVRRGSALFREIDIYIVPAGSYVPTQTLIDQVQVTLQDRSMAGETIYVQGPKHVVGVSLVATVTIQDSYSADDVRPFVESAVSDFFSVGAENAQFGKDVNMSDIMALIDNITGVDHVDIVQLTLDPADTFEWEIAPDDPAIIDYIVGIDTAALIDQTYTITFTAPTTYVVRDGNNVNRGTGTLGTELLTTDGALRMKLSVGTDAMVASDRGVFRTSEYANNAEIEDYEIRKLGTLTLSFEGGA